MPHVFEVQHTVRSDEIDFLGHVNNEVYLRWFNQIAAEHSAERGLPVETMLRRGVGWVIRRHEIDYLSSAMPGDQLILRTWISNIARSSSVRQYEVMRKADGKILAKASSVWVWINYQTIRPEPVPAEIAASFEV